MEDMIRQTMANFQHRDLPFYLNLASTTLIARSDIILKCWVLEKVQVTLLLSPRKAYILKNKTFRAAEHYRLFWRSAENFKTTANYKWYVGVGMLWAVSQAAPLRRIEVENELLLYEYEPPIPQAGYSSGGYFANLLVRNTVSAGSQQQWFARDSTIGGWQGGSWNMVFVGINGTNIPKIIAATKIICYQSPASKLLP